MSRPPTTLAAVVTMALTEAGLSENSVAKLTGIPRQTLRRRLVTGDFKYETELWPIALLLGTTPAKLQAQAEKRAA